MSLLSPSEIKKITKQNPNGVRSSLIVQTFQHKGMRFSEATLRKYVQLDLLPKSERVGQRGRHRGSAGLYPVVVLELINEIKKQLDTGATLEEIRFSRVGLYGDLIKLKNTSNEVLKRFSDVIYHTAKPEREQLNRVFQRQRKNLAKEVAALNKLANLIGKNRNSKRVAN